MQTDTQAVAPATRLAAMRAETGDGYTVSCKGSCLAVYSIKTLGGVSESSIEKAALRFAAETGWHVVEFQHAAVGCYLTALLEHPTNGNRAIIHLSSTNKVEFSEIVPLADWTAPVPNPTYEVHHATIGGLGSSQLYRGEDEKKARRIFQKQIRSGTPGLSYMSVMPRTPYWPGEQERPWCYCIEEYHTPMQGLGPTAMRGQQDTVRWIPADGLQPGDDENAGKLYPAGTGGDPAFCGNCGSAMGMTQAEYCALPQQGCPLCDPAAWQDADAPLGVAG